MKILCWSSQQTISSDYFFHMLEVKACTIFFHQPQLHQSKILTIYFFYPSRLKRNTQPYKIISHFSTQSLQSSKKDEQIFIDAFHLNLLDFTIVYQFYFETITIVESIFWNLLHYSAQRFFSASCLSGGFINATAVNPPERQNWQNTPLCSGQI